MSIVLLTRIAFVGSILAAWALGVFEKRKIIGPPRLGPGDGPRELIGPLSFGLAALAACPLVFQGIHQWLDTRAHRAATTQLSEPETVLFSALMELMVFAGILVGFGLSWTPGLRRVGFGVGKIPRGVVIGILAIVVTLPLIFVVNDITETTLEHFNKSHPAHQLLEVLKTNPPAWLRIADILSAGLIAPVAEEMFFRGILQTMFRAVFRRSWPAIVAAAALFALVHPAWSWPQILVLGTCLGYTYERTGNLWASITMHASFNLFSIYLFTHFS